MILSSPFAPKSRPSRAAWSNGAPYGSLKRAPAAEAGRPGATTSQRANTLSRLELQRPARSAQPAVLSASGRPSSQPVGFRCDPPSQRPPKPHEIYAPASIASPRELQRPESNHYAASSVRGGAPSDSGRSTSGRESSLGNLLNRLGTLRRRARWSRSARSETGASSSQSQSSERPASLQEPDDNAAIASDGKSATEAARIAAEGSLAIDGNRRRRLLEHELNEALMSEGETRTIIDSASKQLPEFRALSSALISWINDELAQQRILITDLVDDLYDGQVLGKLVEKLHSIELDLVEVTHNELAQKQKLITVLSTINRILTRQARWAKIRWSVEGIHGKNLVEIVHLLVTLARFYAAPIKIPADVRVSVLVVQKYQGRLIRRFHEAQLTDSADSRFEGPNQRDAFDTLIEYAPEKLALVERALIKFVNRQLNKIKINFIADYQINDNLDPEQFSDGLLFVFLIASLEEFFVPLGNLFTSIAVPNETKWLINGIKADRYNNKSLPVLNNDICINGLDSSNNFHNEYAIGPNKLETALEQTSYINAQPIQKLHNVNVAFQLMEEAGVEIRNRVRVEDVANGDLKSVLRVLYALFSRYKHL